MVGYRQTLGVILFVFLPISVAIAQNNTNSPYTRYGYGQLSDQTFANSKAMGGIAYALRDGHHVNVSNPSSYSAVDSLTFIFDGGVTLQNTNFSDGTTKLNAKNSSFDYIAMQFKLSKKLGVSAGLIPFSNVGYNISSLDNAGGTDSQNMITYSGDGGLHQFYVGMGFNIVDNLSIGANVSYFWGNISRTTTVLFPSNSSASSYNRLDYFSVKDYKLDLGLQYTHQMGKKGEMTLGLVFSPKNSLNNDANVQISTGNVVSSKDTIVSFGLPNSFGIGLAYVYDHRLTLGFDYSLQKWSDVAYMGEVGSLCDRSKIAIGMEYLPSYTNRNYFAHIKYRLGAYYSEPYYKIDGVRASKEYGITGGIGLPFSRSRSILSLSAQYVKIDGSKDNLLNENYLRLSIGFTFNERWFFKRKVD
ncbi:hypothetical protein [uncultured Bacteroides sp.]|uniref:hypothetical protein n=1 Tax=uncultured Bacteroides sp. TaxID=162156 RepID=UPI002AA72828|nr:hypothetical protein [uncultured Bacteroides sp.]